MEGKVVGEEELDLSGRMGVTVYGDPRLCPFVLL
jgi:hypothetical protein